MSNDIQNSSSDESDDALSEVSLQMDEVPALINVHERFYFRRGDRYLYQNQSGVMRVRVRDVIDLVNDFERQRALLDATVDLDQIQTLIEMEGVEVNQMIDRYNVEFDLFLDTGNRTVHERVTESRAVLDQFRVLLESHYIAHMNERGITPNDRMPGVIARQEHILDSIAHNCCLRLMNYWRDSSECTREESDAIERSKLYYTLQMAEIEYSVYNRKVTVVVGDDQDNSERASTPAQDEREARMCENCGAEAFVFIFGHYWCQPCADADNLHQMAQNLNGLYNTTKVNVTESLYNRLVDFGYNHIQVGDVDVIWRLLESEGTEGISTEVLNLLKLINEVDLSEDNHFWAILVDNAYTDTVAMSSGVCVCDQGLRNSCFDCDICAMKELDQILNVEIVRPRNLDEYDAEAYIRSQQILANSAPVEVVGENGRIITVEFDTPGQLTADEWYTMTNEHDETTQRDNDSASILSPHWERVMVSEEYCVICMETIDAHALRCVNGHTFHEECVRENAQKRSSRCCVCRIIMQF